MDRNSTSSAGTKFNPCMSTLVLQKLIYWLTSAQSTLLGFPHLVCGASQCILTAGKSPGFHNTKTQRIPQIHIQCVDVGNQQFFFCVFVQPAGWMKRSDWSMGCFSCKILPDCSVSIRYCYFLVKFLSGKSPSLISVEDSYYFLPVMFLLGKVIVKGLDSLLPTELP